MNGCSNGNSCLWILILLLILGTYGPGLLSSRAFSGCGWPILAACAYCLCRNGTLSEILGKLGGGSGSGCGCNG